MDRPDETSGSSAAPQVAPFGVREAPSQTAVQLARLDEMLPVSAKQPRSLDPCLPPRPLPAHTFAHVSRRSSIENLHGAASPAIEPALDAQTAAPHFDESSLPETSSPFGEPLAIDTALSEIDAEASSRSLSAIELAIAGALEEIKPRDPIKITEVRLPDGGYPPNGDLGETVPRGLLEPRLWAPPPPPSFDGLWVDPAMRRDLPPIENEPHVRKYGALIKRGGKILAQVVLGWLALVLLLILAYRFVNPPVSALMLQHWLTGRSVSQKWVPIKDMSPNIIRAVLLSEDGRFCDHFGIDLEAMEDAIENSDGRSRGGSTISMQVIKNLFLWPSKSYLRKAVELPLTFVLELVWPKRRIIEVYLNIAEWGPDIFGIGTAAAFHFHKLARSLTVREAAQLAVALPNPLVRNAGKPGPGLQRLANAIQVRMRLAPSSQLSCVLPKRRF